MKTRKWFMQHYLTKTTLAAFAAAVPLFVHADTSWVRGGNWADDGDNFQTGIIYPTGITSSTTTTQAKAVADTIAADDASAGINFVRIGINPATISGNWSVVQAYVNELIADGMTVDLAFWTSSSSVGTVTNESAWQSMWETVDGVYHGNNSVYYEPINEPHGYASETVLGTDVYSPFLGFVSKAQNHIILDGQNTADDVTQVGADSRYTGCLLGLHIYPSWWGKYTTESGWEGAVSAHVGSYASRTIMTEMGAPATTGLNYDASSGNVNVCFIRGVCQENRSLSMGFAYWPSHRANDTFRLFTSIGGGVTNPSLIDQLESGWGFFTPVSAADCDFDAVGLTDYSVFRPSNSGWYIYPSVNPIQFGASTDIAVPADYNGTGQAQPAVWRPSTGDWYVYPSVNPIHWGTTGDIPVPGDYLGTGQAQLTVWRPSNGTWYVDGVASVQWGTNGDIPVPGYYLGDGHVDYAVYRPSNNKWFIRGGPTVQFGAAGDIPVPGDYADNGTTQIAMWRPSNGDWYVYGVGTTTFGITGDIPVPGDYAGVGSTQMATWRPSNNNWYVNGVGIITNWGATGDAPLPLPYAVRHYSLGFNN
ncbi:MAG TPA: cellulase family glycosylhydrolase [Verrucomicrobiae bacterium]|nr:cellulase family glycosylhydrolase [Verrucomicrobiae bacterium]